MEIEKAAHKIARAIKNDITFIKVKDYAENQLGYNVLFIGTERGNRELERIGATAHINEQAFTYKSTINKIIFIDKALSEAEKLFAILHECGHILLNHVDISCYEIDSYRAEREADQIANIVLLTGNRRYKRKYKTLCIVFLIFGIILGFALTYLSSFLTDKQLTEKSISDPSIVSITLPHVTSENFLSSTISPDKTEQRVVYITSNGTKYHLAGCRYIKDKTNVQAVSLNEIDDNYLPCKVCFSTASN